MAQVTDAKISLPSSVLLPGDVFKTGSYTTESKTVKKTDASSPPTDVYLVAPVEKGTYPVLLFLHGFLMGNSWYSEILAHIASHGYMVVAPQIYGPGIFPFNFLWTGIPEERDMAREVSRWISSPGGLPAVLPEKVYRDADKLALAGHSRGGKAAFALALANAAAPSEDDPKFKALIGIDPVAGPSVAFRPDPKILTYKPRSFDMSVPVAVIGAGLSNQWFWVSPPCAADGVNHWEFYNESKPPVCYFVAKDYGHFDMMDEWVARWASLVTQSGKGSRELMRKSVAGLVVASLEAYLDGQQVDLNTIVEKPSVAPITLQPAIYDEK